MMMRILSFALLPAVAALAASPPRACLRSALSPARCGRPPCMFEPVATVTALVAGVFVGSVANPAHKQLAAAREAVAEAEAESAALRTTFVELLAALESDVTGGDDVRAELLLKSVRELRCVCTRLERGG